jgi:hypothetical protein
VVKVCQLRRGLLPACDRTEGTQTQDESQR